MAMWIPQRLIRLFFLHAILIVSTQSSASTSQKNRNLIRQTFRRTNNFNLCAASLESDPQSLKADVKGLAHISLQQVMVKANQTLQIVGKLFNQTHDHLDYEFLGTCIEEYNKAVSIELPGAIIALNSNDYGESKQGAANVRDDANLCKQQ
ncbi:pectinesterase inhibitor-like [Camellia sinensis]|uniref:pectinesterase inhibitor-like n=1 Tax=Camellia sinensis TaxID=4442 RepID=UPI001035EBDF|nr:pectinesterase inhibitor-like [Camellia sinensis]